MQDVRELIVVGSGPAGYTAALYAARAHLYPLVFEGWAAGGQLQQTTEVENFPGFPGGVMGPQLMALMREQATHFGAQLIADEVQEILLGRDGRPHQVNVDGQLLQAKALILATGAQALTLGLPGEQQLGGRGVSYCATCDAPFFEGADVVVVGGGDSAMEEAIFLAKFARKVTIVHRREQFRASRVMLARAQAVANIEWLVPYEVVQLHEGDLAPHSLQAITVRHANGDERRLEATGLFVAIGHRPRSELVADQLPLDDQGYVLVEAHSTKTVVPGVFACGDLTDHRYRQAITAAGSGCQAALDAERYLRDLRLPS